MPSTIARSGLVATSGLSTGVNTPARIVIIRDLKLGVSDLEVSQAQQMLGRAGRAGKEPEGFGYLLVPRDRETEWRAKLTEGYRVKSQLVGQIGDVLLAEILLGSITSREDAQIWFKGTFAYAQSSNLHDVGAVIDELVKHRLVADQNGTLTITDLGKLTARLMIGVSAACGILDSLGALGFPTQALEAENQVLALIVNSVPAIQDLPINARIYEDWVSQTLNGCGHGLGVHIGHNDDNFKSRFAAAVAVAALREPGRLSVPVRRKCRAVNWSALWTYFPDTWRGSTHSGTWRIALGTGSCRRPGPTIGMVEPRTTTHTRIRPTAMATGTTPRP